MKRQLFDDWPDQYDRWFETPVGSLVKASEQALVMELLDPVAGERILDAGCGTGVFTLEILAAGSSVVGIDLSLPMLYKAHVKAQSSRFSPVAADILRLPFKEQTFDKTVSITALEFIENGGVAVRELFRVTKAGGVVLVATLNSLSPWAKIRREEATKKETIFSRAIFRSPDDMRSLAPLPGIVKTAVHFPKDVTPKEATQLEKEGKEKGLQTGAFIAVRWQKP
ncbi:MAG TPA: class I SAM-dependent methyltransferase [Syntrophorhabdales bacterium]|nr:class I SAM-dependent methyltransferase [Syntrophorhabdales bacterium]